MTIETSLQKRLLSSAFLVSITLVVIFMAPEWLFFAVVQAFNLLALYEYFLILEKKNLKIHRLTGLFFGAWMGLAILNGTEFLVLASAALVFFCLYFGKNDRDHAFLAAASSLFGILYISGLFTHLIKIHQLDHGPAFVFYTILVTKAGDAGAYFVGKKFGRVKLIEHISPHKSVEGAVGGFLTTLILSLISKIYLPSVSVIHLIFLGVIVGITSQLGDLVESLIKRDAGVKDSGHVPGLGGILDVLDSLIFTIPFVYYCIYFLT